MKFGLIGHPIEHSLSPALFKAGYDGKYPYDLIEEQDFEKAYQRFLAEYDGINVTSPFKETALLKADIVSDECRMIGATNLLVKSDAGVTAYNSDYRGLVLLLETFHPADRATDGVLPPWPQGVGPTQWEGFRQRLCPADGRERYRALIVGMGGAGKAAAAAARTLGYETVLMNRTQYSPDILPLETFREEFRKADIIIYNLPVAIPQLEELSDEDFTPGRTKILLEANYRNPSFSKELADKALNINPDFRHINGNAWLLYQALTGYELFTGEKPDLSRMSDVL